MKNILQMLPDLNGEYNEYEINLSPQQTMYLDIIKHFAQKSKGEYTNWGEIITENKTVINLDDDNERDTVFSEFITQEFYHEEQTDDDLIYKTDSYSLIVYYDEKNDEFDFFSKEELDSEVPEITAAYKIKADDLNKINEIYKTLVEFGLTNVRFVKDEKETNEIVEGHKNYTPRFKESISYNASEFNGYTVDEEHTEYFENSTWPVATHDINTIYIPTKNSLNDLLKVTKEKTIEETINEKKEYNKALKDITDIVSSKENRKEKIQEFLKNTPKEIIEKLLNEAPNNEIKSILDGQNLGLDELDKKRWINLIFKDREPNSFRFFFYRSRSKKPILQNTLVFK